MPTLLALAALALAAGLLVWAAASDFARYRIPNAASLGLAAAFLVFAFSQPDVGFPWLGHLKFGALALALGLLAFVKHLAGGGDGKLFAAVALWAGPERVLPAVLLIALIGGVLAAAQLLAVMQQRARLAGGYRAAGLPPRSAWGSAPVPYGIAIAGGGLYALWGLAAPLI